MNITLKGNTLTITCELPEKGKGVRSASGKTMVLDSTRGNTPVVNETGRQVIVGLNVYEK